MARKSKAGAGEPARPEPEAVAETAPPTMPGRAAWVKDDFTPDSVREMLDKAKAPGGPDFADLKAAASRLNDLVTAIFKPPPPKDWLNAPPRPEPIAARAKETAPPRPETIAAWCKETATAADALLRRLGADPVEIARGGAVMPAEARAEARDSLRDILEPALMLAPPESPLAGLARDMGGLATHERAKPLAPALEGLGLIFLALQEAEAFWRGLGKGGGRNEAHRARLLVAHGAAAYRHATGKEPGLSEQGPALRFLEILAARLGVVTTPQGTLGHLRRGVAKTSAKKGEK